MHHQTAVAAFALEVDRQRRRAGHRGRQPHIDFLRHAAQPRPVATEPAQARHGGAAAPGRPREEAVAAPPKGFRAEIGERQIVAPAAVEDCGAAGAAAAAGEALGERQ